MTWDLSLSGTVKKSFVSVAIRPLNRLPVSRRPTATTVLAMASNQNTKAQQAWRAVLLHKRMDVAMTIAHVIAAGCTLWDEYRLQDVNTRGPIELYKPSWFKNHFGWGTWLARCRSWAILMEESMNGQLLEYLRMVVFYKLLFKEPVVMESDDFWKNIKDARCLLKCYLDGWKLAIMESAFDDWVVNHPQSWTTHEMLRNHSSH